MPSPKRRHPSDWVGTGFCRHEVQKVLRAFHARGAPAWLCLAMYRTVIFLQDSRLRPLALKPTPHEKTISQFVTNNLVRHREMFVALFTAVIASDKRLGSLPNNAPEKVVEQNFSALRDVEKNKKLAEALPKGFRGNEDSIRVWLSKANAKVAWWERNSAAEAAQIVPVLNAATGMIELYQKRPKK